MSFHQDFILSDFSDGEVNRMFEENGDPLAVRLTSDFEWTAHVGSVDQTGPHIQTIAYPGDYNFVVTVPETAARNTYLYSHQLNRVYVDMNKAVPFKFSWDGPTVLHVRAVMVFTEPDEERKAVLRCRMHSAPEDPSNDGFPYPSHVIRSDDESTLYCENSSSRRHSVVKMLGEIPEGGDGVTVTYRFMCKTSCVGGINRNKTDVVFTLEDSNNHIVGRAVIGVKICACPRRDKEKDEAPVSGKKRRSDSSIQQQHFLQRLPKTDISAFKTEPHISAVKTEPGYGYKRFMVTVPESRAAEFQSFFKIFLTGASMPDQTIEATAGNAIVEF